MVDHFEESGRDFRVLCVQVAGTRLIATRGIEVLLQTFL